MVSSASVIDRLPLHLNPVSETVQRVFHRRTKAHGGDPWSWVAARGGCGRYLPKSLGSSSLARSSDPSSGSQCKIAANTRLVMSVEAM